MNAIAMLIHKYMRREYMQMFFSYHFILKRKAEDKMYLQTNFPSKF